jgi:hypothetical protein
LQSGCTNCVWEIYAAELAAWKAARANASNTEVDAAGGGQQKQANNSSSVSQRPNNLASVSMSAFEELEASLAGKSNSTATSK